MNVLLLNALTIFVMYGAGATWAAVMYRRAMYDANDRLKREFAAKERWKKIARRAIEHLDTAKARLKRHGIRVTDLNKESTDEFNLGHDREG